MPSQISATSQTPAEGRQTVPAALFASAGQVVLAPVQVSAGSQTPADARQTVPGLPAGCVHAGAPTVPLHTSAVHTLPSAVQLVPAALTVSGGQFELAGASAMSWLILAAVELFVVEPGAACKASEFSEAASLVVAPLSIWNRSVIPDGAAIAVPSSRPKQATSIVLKPVVVIDTELVCAAAEALIGAVVSTLKYALIPPDRALEDDTVKV